VPGYTLTDGITVKNKVFATSQDQLERLEVEYVVPRVLEIELGFGPTGQFNAEHLKAIHRHLFQDVYEWAGHTRDERVALSDGTVATEPILSKVDGQPFLIGPAIPAALDHIATKLRAAGYLRGLPREEFAERAADVMVELNATHAFREGNGRTQRVFIRQLGKEAGHGLDFSVVSRERMIKRASRRISGAIHR
jgi:cell filamentation protein